MLLEQEISMFSEGSCHIEVMMLKQLLNKKLITVRMFKFILKRLIVDIFIIILGSSIM